MKKIDTLESPLLCSTISKAFKSHTIGKKDGGIINSLLDDIGTLITDRKEIAKELMKTIAQFQINPNIQQVNPIEFPTFSFGEIGDIHEIVQGLNFDKAISWDGITDDIFRKHNLEKTKDIFVDLWTNASIIDIHFLCRLVPLNKKYPQIPT